MSYTLVVVDMQATFRASNKRKLNEVCLKEIRRAKRTGSDIIFLEYSGHGKTHDSLLKAAKGANFFIMKKNDDDGSREVRTKVRSKKLNTNFRVCGVNTDACVVRTVQGLTLLCPMSKIEVVGNACASDWKHLNGINQMKKMPQVKVLYNKNKR